MTKTLLKTALAWLVIIGATNAFGQSFFSTNGDTHGAFRDTSNITFDFGTSYNLHLDTQASDPDLYINNMIMTPGVGYDPLLDLQTHVGSFDYNGSESGTYNFGTAISGDHNWDFSGVFRNSGAINAAVADGMYDFSLDILGGGDALATSILASFEFHLEVIQKLEIGATYTMNPGSILEGGFGTEMSMTVQNNMTGHDFVSTTWYVSGFGDGNGNQLAFDNFTGDWFDKHLTPGSNRTDSHSTWHANLDTPIGFYSGHNGIVGGLYNGDFYFVEAAGPDVEVLVPEPASMTALGLGALVLLRRRRKA